MFIEAKDDGGGGDNWTTGAISRAKLQSNHHQQTNIKFFYRLDGLPVTQPTVSKHWREKPCMLLEFVFFPQRFINCSHTLMMYISVLWCMICDCFAKWTACWICMCDMTMLIIILSFSIYYGLHTLKITHTCVAVHAHNIYVQCTPWTRRTKPLLFLHYLWFLLTYFNNFIIQSDTWHKIYHHTLIALLHTNKTTMH